VAVASLLPGCSTTTAKSACESLAAVGVGTNCHETKPAGLGAAAIEAYAFDLPSVSGKTGRVLRFEKAEYYDSTVDSFAKAALLAGPHRYGNRGKLIFVQMNDKASLDVGKKAKAVVDGL